MKLNEVMGTCAGISRDDYKENFRDKDSLEILTMEVSILTRVRDFN